MAELSVACGTEIKRCQIDDVITITTLSSEDRTADAINTLCRLVAVMDVTLSAITAHKSAAIHEFSGLINDLGLSEIEQYTRYFELKVSEGLLFEINELKAQQELFKSMEAIVRHVQTKRDELDFDQTDIIFPSQYECDKYFELVDNFYCLDRKARDAVLARGAYMQGKLQSFSSTLIRDP
jgi:hypothetical protein